ncbi:MULTISPECIES: acyl carrier protein [Sedimentibacter]|uniref:Acyl carrier protein n=1 Tax=Sedimentibacter hydroxybenzoicus DSM 7310 TaxID=1123245 RepID=A0A974GWL1_SEDHY|nr:MULTISPECIES: acyl carrier protein [Sedimentibacter]NYB74604.1 acyl carrier protein [Sedimentibacter hydroxybenzoicus DSM 7310]
MILEKVKEILIEELDVEEDKITLESKIKDDLGADSLDLFELISKIEDELNVTIEEDDYGKLVTVKDIVDYITEKQK